MNVQSIINHCLGLGYRDLENYAGENYVKVYNYICKETTGENANTLLIGSILTCVASDGKLSDLETKFMQSFIGGYTYDSALNAASNFYNDEAQNIVKNLYNKFPSDVKEAYVKMCIAVLAVDKKIADYERCFLNKIL